MIDLPVEFPADIQKTSQFGVLFTPFCEGVGSV